MRFILKIVDFIREYQICTGVNEWYTNNVVIKL